VLLTITTTREPATDLGYLLHKHPDRLQQFGAAYVFYPEATEKRCTAALLLEVDPIGLVRGAARAGRGAARAGRGGAGVELTQYVNDRPYAASSMLAVALKEAFRTALAGRCDARPELVTVPIPLEIRVPALRCKGAVGQDAAGQDAAGRDAAGQDAAGRGGAELARRVFEPLGWTVEVSTAKLDPPQWGDSPYLDLRLRGALTVKDALNHLYVLLPVLDDAKHYWVSTDEIDKLIRAGGDWLAAHPEKGLITRRYLAHRRELAESALARLAEADEVDAAELDNAVADEDEDQAGGGTGEQAGERGRPLAALRREAIVGELRAAGATTVGDFGCGSGALTGQLLKEKVFTKVVATDVSARALQLAARRLHLDRLPGGQRDRLTIFQSSLLYRDDRLAGLDAAVLMEVIEHVDPERLPALELALFGFAAPGTVLVTTPNAEYNKHYEGLTDGALRHRDHRFEWTRAEFAAWAGRVAPEYGYTAELRPVGPQDPRDGSPSQLAVFTKPAVSPGEAR
jgi:3' terminal RNA ribose 2'-O-methyltransferase Hen1